METKYIRIDSEKNWEGVSSIGAKDVETGEVFQVMMDSAGRQSLKDIFGNMFAVELGEDFYNSKQ